MRALFRTDAGNIKGAKGGSILLRFVFLPLFAADCRVLAAFGVRRLHSGRSDSLDKFRRLLH